MAHISYRLLNCTWAQTYGLKKSAMVTNSTLEGPKGPHMAGGGRSAPSFILDIYGKSKYRVTFDFGK